MFTSSTNHIGSHDSLEVRLSALITEPIYWLLIALFLNISGITDYLPALQSLESIVFAAGVATAALRFLSKLVSKTGDDVLEVIYPSFAAFGFGIVSCSILSTYISSGVLDILDQGGWKHFAKFVISSCICLTLYRPGEHIKIFNGVIYLALTVLAGSILFRFFILEQIHPESGRMALQGRHGDPNFACMYMTIGFVFTAMHLKQAARIQEKVLHIMLSLLFVTTAWFTESRAGLVVFFATILGLVFLFPWNFSKTRALVGILIAASLAIGTFGSRLVDRYASIDDASNIGRVAGILAAKDMVIEQPIWGSGFNSSHRYLETNYDVLFRSTRIALEIHTTQLQVAAELGLIGLLVYGSLFFTILLQAFRRIKINPKDCIIPVAYTLVALSILVNMLSIPLTYTGTIYGLILVLLHNLGAKESI